MFTAVSLIFTWEYPNLFFMKWYISSIQLEPSQSMVRMGIERGGKEYIAKKKSNKELWWYPSHLLLPITPLQFPSWILEEFGSTIKEWVHWAKFTYFFAMFLFWLWVAVSWSPNRTASASSRVVSVVAPRNLDVSSRSNSRRRTLLPFWYFLVWWFCHSNPCTFFYSLHPLLVFYTHSETCHQNLYKGRLPRYERFVQWPVYPWQGPSV